MPEIHCRERGSLGAEAECQVQLRAGSSWAFAKFACRCNYFEGVEATKYVWQGQRVGESTVLCHTLKAKPNFVEVQ